MLLFELANSLIDAIDSDGVGVPHGPATPGRKAVAMDIHDVDIGGAEGEAFFQDFRSFVDEGEDRALDNFLGVDRSALNAGRASTIGDDFLHFGIRHWRAAAFGIAIPSSAGLLSKAAELAQSIGGEGVAEARRST